MKKEKRTEKVHRTALQQQIESDFRPRQRQLILIASFIFSSRSFIDFGWLLLCLWKMLLPTPFSWNSQIRIHALAQQSVVAADLFHVTKPLRCGRLLQTYAIHWPQTTIGCYWKCTYQGAAALVVSLDCWCWTLSCHHLRSHASDCWRWRQLLKILILF